MNFDTAGLEIIFPVHPIPLDVFLKRHPSDSDCAEGYYLINRKWTEVDYDFWEDNWTIITALNAVGFHYYSPSFLVAGLLKDFELCRDSVLSIMDTSGDTNIFTDFLIERLSKFDEKQFSFIFKWLESVKSLDPDVDSNRLIRANRTLSIFKCSSK